jgi:putative oxidoreductase
MSGRPQPPLAHTIFSFALAIVFVSTGASKLIDHQQAVIDFTRWGLPAPGVLTVVIALFELCAAALLMAGVAVRRVAIALALEMVVALAVAGPVDGGGQLVVPPRLAALCLGLAWISQQRERVAAR